MAAEPYYNSEEHVPPPISKGEERGTETPSSIQEDMKTTEFKPSARLYLAFLTLAVITLMVALDGTSLSVALPVCSESFPKHYVCSLT